jgi:hypothetical protein
MARSLAALQRCCKHANHARRRPRHIRHVRKTLNAWNSSIGSGTSSFQCSDIGLSPSM